MEDKQKYYIVVDDKMVIWGSGINPTQAKKNALDSIKSVMPLYRVDPSKLCKRPIPCSKRLYDQVSEDGATKEDTWTMIEGVAELDEHINTPENISSMRSLIDGAYEIVYIYKPDSPASIKWREEWLDKARKCGAGFDC